MRKVQHICKHGSSAAVSIPRPFLYKLNWIVGQDVMVFISDDCQSLIIRPPRASDFGVALSPQALKAEAEASR